MGCEARCQLRHRPQEPDEQSRVQQEFCNAAKIGEPRWRGLSFFVDDAFDQDDAVKSPSGKRSVSKHTVCELDPATGDYQVQFASATRSNAFASTFAPSEGSHVQV